MYQSFPPLPKAACQYEKYDSETLIPCNSQTYVRLIELGWDRQLFDGKSVLDIGCNTGLLSIYASQLGAASVIATDVQTELIEFFSEVVEAHDLNIAVEKQNFWATSSSQYRSDVVLCMEVLHWIVDQGGDLSEAINHLASLTKEILFIETPWDINEPSIASKGKIDSGQYNIERIIRELMRHFRNVQIVRFMTYFGKMEDSKRILIKSSSPRNISIPVPQFDEINYLDISIARGANSIELATMKSGQVVIKTLPKQSNLAKIDDEVLNELFGFLGEVSDPVLVLPKRIGGSFRLITRDGQYSMVFPFVGRLSDYFPDKRSPQPVDSPVKASIDLRQQLRDAPAKIVSKFRDVSPPVAKPNLELLSSRFAAAGLPPETVAFIAGIAERMPGYDREQEDSLTHSDMQTGNMLTDSQGRRRIVDLDLMRSGTAYSDLLTCIIFNGATVEELNEAVGRLEAINRRSVTEFDIDFSVSLTLGWLNAVVSQQLQVSDRAISNLFAGIEKMQSLHSRL